MQKNWKETERKKNIFFFFFDFNCIYYIGIVLFICLAVQIVYLKRQAGLRDRSQTKFALKKDILSPH